MGAYGDDDNGNDSGSVYVYERDGASWETTDIATHETKITASDGAAGDAFGQKVAVSGDGGTSAVGAHLDDDNATDSGSVSVYISD